MTHLILFLVGFLIDALIATIFFQLQLNKIRKYLQNIQVRIDNLNKNV